MKNILVISYSQSGQLDSILDNFLLPFKGVNIDRVKVKPEDDFPFPWTSPTFFDAMPETVLEHPRKLAPYSLAKEEYQLIIFGYQPWYLSPSQPAMALLQDEKFRKVLKDTPVVTVIGARNMWLQSQKSIVREVNAAGGYMVGNVPLIDRAQNHISALTILHWLLTGEKTRKWGFLPLPGVSDEDIKAARQYGEPVAEAINHCDYLGLQRKILQKGGIKVSAALMLVESRGKMLFNIWANLIRKKGTNPEKRAVWVNRFKWYLTIALFVVSPPVLVIFTLLRPLMFLKIRRNKQHYLYLGIKR